MMKTILIAIIFVSACFAKKTSDFLPHSFKANIKQSYKSQISGKIRESIGYVEYQRPYNLVFSIEGKNNFTLVMNKKKSWYYVPPLFEEMKGELTIGDTRKNPVSEALILLRHGLESNNIYKVKGTELVKKLMIEPKRQQELGLSEIRLHFKDKNKLSFQDIKFMEIFQIEKDKIKMTFDNLTEKVNFSKSHFTFKIPKNTNVNGKFSSPKKPIKKKKAKI